MTCDTCIWKSEEEKLDQKQVYSGLTNTMVWVGVKRLMKVCAITNPSVSIESRVNKYTI